MKRKTTIIIAAAAMTAAGILAAEKLPAEKSNLSNNLSQPNIITVSRPQLQTFTKSCHWFGTVKSFNKSSIIALESGQIIAVKIPDNTPAAQGDSLFDIGGDVFNTRLNALQKQESILDERINLAEQLTSLRQDAVARHLARQSELITARDSLAQLKLAKAGLMQTISHLNQAAHLTAPCSGIFTERKVTVGQQVQKGDILAIIISPEQLYIEAALFTDSPHKLLHKTAFIEAAGSGRIRAAVSSIQPHRTASGATLIQIKLKSMQSKLLPGETVEGSVILYEHKNALALPQSSIVRGEDDLPYIFVQDKSGYTKQSVTTGCRRHDLIEITAGLNADDKVVTQGAYELFYRDFNKIYKLED
jgi:RND family efflux transporter MFP subunit